MRRGAEEYGPAASKMRPKGAAGGEKFGNHQRPFGSLVTHLNHTKPPKICLEKLGAKHAIFGEAWKRLAGRLYSATVGSCRQQPPIERDRHCEEKLRSNPGSRSSRERRPERGKAAGPFHPRGPAGGRCGTCNVRGERASHPSRRN